MSTYNNSLLYFKHYYTDKDINWQPANEEQKKVNEPIFKKKNEQLFGAVFPKESQFSYPSAFNVIELKTTYPGLLLGSGIAHGSGLLGEMKLGFFLDYTTGLPVIPGSSVKGVLRSAFPQGYCKAAKKEGTKEEEKTILEAKAAQTIEYLKYYLEEITKKSWDKEAVDALETFLFGSYKTGKSDSAMSGRPVFHDAVPLNADRVSINGKNTENYLGDDYITPHNKGKGNIPAALRNPIPIAFLKVLPGVAFRFQFVLSDFKHEEGNFKLTKKQIEQLFRHILLDFGIGAKTNVGYGRLEALDDFTLPAAQKAENRTPQKAAKSVNQPASPKAPPPPPSTPESTIPSEYHYRKPLHEGQDLVGKVVKNKKDKHVLLIVVDGIAVKRPCPGIENFELNTLIKAKNTSAKYGNLSDQLTDPQPLEKPE